MPRFIFFTKTRWAEPPRLRHQVARLVAAAGHDVVFFEKPASFGPASAQAVHREDRIVSLQHRELLHHRLRVSSVLQRANARVTASSIRSRLRERPIRADDRVVCFNYDYWFLRRLFPGNEIITIINDDFISIALLGYTRPLLWALQRTCAISDRVLTVSVPLQKQLAPYSDPELFLPWADRPYRRPAGGTERDILLFWGYVNARIDFEAVSRYAAALERTRPEVRMVFVGPVDEKISAAAVRLRSRSNVELWPTTALDELPLDRILAACIPYRAHDPEIDAITISNKGFQLLARGLPLLISSLPAVPNFIEAPFVFRMDHEAPGEQIDRLRSCHADMQPHIERFVAGNGPDARLRQLFREAT